MNEDPATLHKYLYASGDAVNGSDPTGNFTLTEIAVVGTVVAVISVGSWLLYKYLYGSKEFKLLTALEKSKPMDDDKVFRIAGTLDSMARTSSLPDNSPILEKLRKLRSMLGMADDGSQIPRSLAVHVYDKDFKYADGAHLKFISGKAFVSERVVELDPDYLALVIFAEFQHDAHGDGLDEQRAQDEFVALRDSLPEEHLPASVANLKHGVDGL